VIISPVEYLLWAINRDTYVEAIIATNLAQWGWTEKLATKAINPATGLPDYPPVLLPGPGMQIDELGQIPASANPAIMVEGWHVNTRVYEQQLDNALEKYIATLVVVGADHGVPPAAMDVNGMKWLRPYKADGITPTIATRRRIWA
jgi:hypothetical protein